MAVCSFAEVKPSSGHETDIFYHIKLSPSWLAQHDECLLAAGHTQTYDNGKMAASVVDAVPAGLVDQLAEACRWIDNA